MGSSRNTSLHLIEAAEALTILHGFGIDMSLFLAVWILKTYSSGQRMKTAARFWESNCRRCWIAESAAI